MRNAAKVDANHAAVVKELRKIATVLSLAAVGKGCPDLLVAFRGVNVLLEVKDGAKAPSDRALNAQQAEFFATWAGPVFLVMSPEEAVRVVVEAARPTASEMNT